jgi:hypothetical protein
MALKKLVGLAAIGGFLYANKKRGGQLTLESFKETARSLIDDLSARARELTARAEQKLQEQRAGGRVTGESAGTSAGTSARTSATEQAEQSPEQTTAYGSAGPGYGST